MALRIAVIGSGISGLAAAWLLARRHAVTLFEASTYLGGHTHSVDVRLGGVTHPVDTGFLVFNRETYPNLVRPFDTLGIIGTKSEMSFSLSLEEPAIEWSGTSLGTLFAQPRNLLRPRFLGMLREILRFNRDAARARGALRDATERLSFVPFDPSTKRSEALVRERDVRLRVVKGAPLAVAALAAGTPDLRAATERLAAGGRRGRGGAAGPQRAGERARAGARAERPEVRPLPPRTRRSARLPGRPSRVPAAGPAEGRRRNRCGEAARPPAGRAGPGRCNRPSRGIPGAT